MSGSSEEPNLFLRKQYASDDHGEEWDDSALISAYDKTVSVVKRKLTRKIQRELGLKDEDVEEFLSDANSSSSKSKKKNKKKKSKKRKWAVGNSCQAVYSEDGVVYEAVIVKIIDNNWAMIRFVGYENEEEVLLEDLTPSLGKNVIQAQIKAANQQEEEGEAESDGYVEIKSEAPEVEIPSAVWTQQTQHSQTKGHTQTFEPTMRRSPMTFPVPLPPPPPPGPPLSVSKNSGQRQEDLNSMLMSWYMCGYYAGLYERGLELNQHPLKNKSKY